MYRIIRLSLIGVVIVAIVLSLLSWLGYRVPTVTGFFSGVYRKVSTWFRTNVAKPGKEGCQFIDPKSPDGGLA